TGFLKKGARGVRIEISKKENEVLLSDFSLWHSVLNYWQITDSEKEDEDFDRMLKLNNIKFVDKGKYTPELKQKVEESWDKIFDMNYSTEYAARPFDKKYIQATFWKLSIDEVRKVEVFTAR
ncbi:MAG: DUF3841 domain-containing protein, partial [Niabella sp.]|nr:DUF3841 domain-containing protein [Niabella sp.]